MKSLVVIGGGGLGREVVATVLAAPGVELLGVIDDGRPDVAALARLGTRHLGGMNTLGGLPDGTGFVVGIGSPDARCRAARLARERGLRPVTVCHPSAAAGGDIRVDEGAILMAGVVLTANIAVGAMSVLNVGVLVSHDSTIEDHVTINPGAVIADDVVVGAGSFLGSACLIPRGSRVPPGTAVAPGERWVQGSPE